MSDPRPLLTRTETAKRLGLSYRSVQYAVAGKKLRERRVPSPTGVGTLPRYAPADVEAYIAAGWSRGPR